MCVCNHPYYFTTVSLLVPIKQQQDQDSQVMPYRMGFTRCVEHGDWIGASLYVELMNNCLTPEHHIDDLPSFNVEPNSFEAKAKLPNSAMMYCRTYMPIVERAVSMERSKLYNSYKMEG